ncbi:MAG: hypothetical protein JO336_16470 [Acidobacteriia bacterium]|nr:hypothetical protein [Terriglobia bacterium]
MTTAPANSDKGKVVLSLDGVSVLGSGTVNANGSFTENVTIPAGVAPGNHKIRAMNGTATAEAAITVTAANVTSSKASMMMVGILTGEAGCPNHPIISTETGSGFRLYGTGFASGVVAVHLDTPTGLLLGTASTQADGSFCQQMNGVPNSQAGKHMLLAIENNAVRAQIPVSFVSPSVIH